MADTDPKFQFAVGMDATILKTQVSGFFKRDEKETSILVLPTDVDTDVKLSFDDLLEAIANQFKIDEESIRNVINGFKVIFPSFSPEKIAFQLNQIFFYYKNVKTEPPTDQIFEYAFSIKIDLGDFLDLAGIVSIKSLYLSIWNTQKKSVLQRFNMDDILNLLPQ